MARQTLTAFYFVLTFLAGAAVGSWTLWVYLMGGGATAMLPVQSVPQEAAVPAPVAAPAPVRAAPATPETVKLQPPAPADESPQDARPGAETPGSGAAMAESTPTPKGHWKETVVTPRSHEECLALTRELNDAYKDCRFGTQKREWVPE